MSQIMIYEEVPGLFKELIQEKLDIGYHIISGSMCTAHIWYPAFFSCVVWKNGHEMFVAAPVRQIFVDEVNELLASGWCFVKDTINAESLDQKNKGLPNGFYCAVLYKD